jgi:hypothetical protein
MIASQNNPDLIASEEKDNVGSLSTFQSSIPPNTNLHFVERNGGNDIGKPNEGAIPGFDATLMGARGTLSSADEKKLLRRIDWRLIPLLAVIYMLKSVDFTNVWIVYLMIHDTDYHPV